MSMSESIQAVHLNRQAVVYIRQSSPHQVIHHQESLKLQRNLCERARSLGWGPDRVRVIDTDLGRSGRTTDGRAGFQELVTLVTLDQVGILLAYDVTRLARNCTDWYQLLDLCGHRRCLVSDQDGIYDPATPNGRLILGLKGMISELELHTIRRRMTDGLLQKARRGDLTQRLPAGLVRDALGQVAKHPDQEVQSRLALVYDTFLRLRTLTQTVRFFNQRDLRVPRHDRFGEVVWQQANTQSIYNILQNPAYAGAFVRGRRCSTARAGKRVVQRVPMLQWPICVRDKYPAYIDWVTFEKIQSMLHDNHSEYTNKQTRGVPRSGKALLTGILYCGECGHKMSVRYRPSPYYACHFRRTKYQVGPNCQRVSAASIDCHVVQAFFEALAPAEMQAFEHAFGLLQQEAAQVRQAQQQQLDRLRYQAQLAERQFHRADPDNRLVAAELERRWEVALRELKNAEELVERGLASPPVRIELDPSTRDSFMKAEQKIVALWQGSRLTLAQQKALLRCLIDKVVVQRLTGATVQLRIIWKGGEATTAVLQVPAASWSNVANATDVEEAIIQLSREGKSDQEIAKELAARGYRSTRTSGFSAHMVLRIRLRRRVLHDRTRSRRSVPGYMTVTQLAERLKTAPHRIYERIYDGRIAVTRDPRSKMYLFPDEPRMIKLIQRLLAGKVQKVRCKGVHQHG
jgi:DNA invertase Pin-like site-specific DNA recombinase